MVEACVVPSGVDGSGSGGGAPVAQAMAEARVVAVPVPATSEAAAEASPPAARFDDDRLTDGEGVMGGRPGCRSSGQSNCVFPIHPTPTHMHGAGAILHPGRASYQPPVGEWKDGFFACFNQCAPTCKCLIRDQGSSARLVVLHARVFPNDELNNRPSTNTHTRPGRHAGLVAWFLPCCGLAMLSKRVGYSSYRFISIILTVNECFAPPPPPLLLLLLLSHCWQAEWA